MLERVEGLALADFDILEADRGAPAPSLWQSQSGDFDMPSRPRSTWGRLVHVGMVDELSERTIAVIEDAHGRLRYAGFEGAEDLAQLVDLERGAIVEFEPREAMLKPADRVVARIAAETGGLYSPAHHQAMEPHADPTLVTEPPRIPRRLGCLSQAAMAVCSVAA